MPRRSSTPGVIACTTRKPRFSRTPCVNKKIGGCRPRPDWAGRGEVKLDPPPLGALETVLRPYQKEGVAWLRFLRANGFGGILADEMGLGKTLQVLAHLDALKNTAPSLIVCPTSLVFNWEAEAAKFTSGLRVLSLQGPQRHEQFAKSRSAI